MLDVKRLRGAAWALDKQAGNVEYAVRRLRSRVDQTIGGGRWKGPSAERHRRGMEDRFRRLSGAAEEMRTIANRLRERANQLEAEERRRRAAAAGGRA
jgi:uncharacterized protein YukE